MNDNLLQELENKVDQDYNNSIVPHRIFDIAAWHLLTVSEDMARFHFNHTIEIEPEQIFVYMHFNAYALKNALGLISKKTEKSKVTLNKKLNGDFYSQYRTLFDTSLKYEKTSRLIMGAYVNNYRIERHNDIYNLIYNSGLVDPRYGALEVLNHGKKDEGDITGVLYHLFGNFCSDQKLVNLIRRDAAIKNRLVTYEYTAELALYICKMFPQRENLIPNEFVFPWGGWRETQALINSLLIRCMYHVVTVEMLATSIHPITGGGVESLVLQITALELRAHLSFFADVGDEKIDSFINHLTYGYLSKNPDPSLQPILKLENGELLLPCYSILNNNLQRNVLSLLSRVNPNSFNAQSSLFEKCMVDDLLQIKDYWSDVFFNEIVASNKRKEEIDVLLFDKANKFILAVELRWVTPPGDAREVHNKSNACREKVEQISRKVNFIRVNLHDVINVRVISEDLDDCSEWRVEGIVIIKGYGGVSSNIESIPMMTADVFLANASKFKSLPQLYAWAKSLSWLPNEGEHFDILEEIINVDDVIVTRTGISMTEKSKFYFKYHTDSVEHFL
ncbi:hypothetical protein [Aeromonas salmonicida]|uniref:hypothetical protein n=1 Tax=Aeromonas salmonicida TaxID=645 RepID=UPI00240DAE83|nr:hypothetical protein [Aeromonas salmonicida]WFC14318.1 hypothetical protein L3V47_00715 [Aeromonas salmonicida]